MPTARLGLFSVPAPDRRAARRHRAVVPGLRQPGGPPAALNQPQRHGTTVIAARTTRDCLARFFTENRDDIIAGLALILALSTIFLWFATRDLVAGTADFSKMQLRAYLGASETFITGVAREKPTVECTVRNFGQTPAYRVSSLGRGEAAQFDVGPLRADRAGRRRAHHQSGPRRLHHQGASG